MRLGSQAHLLLLSDCFLSFVSYVCSQWKTKKRKKDPDTFVVTTAAADRLNEAVERKKDKISDIPNVEIARTSRAFEQQDQVNIILFLPELDFTLFVYMFSSFLLWQCCYWRNPILAVTKVLSLGQAIWLRIENPLTHSLEHIGLCRSSIYWSYQFLRVVHSNLTVYMNCFKYGQHNTTVSKDMFIPVIWLPIACHSSAHYM